ADALAAQILALPDAIEPATVFTHLAAALVALAAFGIGCLLLLVRFLKDALRIWQRGILQP
ncbi:MAG: hypothetical protein AAF368_18620, partial [Planctomycetota bacterium]